MADKENRPQDQNPAAESTTESQPSRDQVVHSSDQGESDAGKHASSPALEAEAQAGIEEKGENLAAKAKQSFIIKPTSSQTSETKPAVDSSEKRPDEAKSEARLVFKSPISDKPAEKPSPLEPTQDQPIVAEKPLEKPAPKVKPITPEAKPPSSTKPAGEAKPEVKRPAKALAVMPTVEITNDPLIKAIREKFTAAIEEALEINGQQVVRVTADRVHDLLLYLRDEADPAFNMLTDLTALHLPDREKPFDLVYMPYALSVGRRLRIKTAISESELVESVCDIWSTANWLEREVYDLLGVRFAKHPDLRRILLPPGWQGHPLRKDYPLEYQDNAWTAQNLKIRELPTEGDYTGKFE